MRGIAILTAFALAGTLLENGLHLPLPGNVLGLILFTASLFLGWIKAEWVEDAAHFLLKHMMLFFVPFVAGVELFWPMIRAQWVTIGVSWLLSSACTLLAAGAVTAWLSRPGKKGAEKGRNP